MVASLTLPKVSTVSDLAFNIASVLANSVLKDSSFKPLPYVYHNIVYILWHKVCTRGCVADFNYFMLKKFVWFIKKVIEFISHLIYCLIQLSEDIKNNKKKTRTVEEYNKWII